MDWENPGTWASTLFVIYRGIPFAYELRTFLDWTVTKTTLTWYEWLKFEDIYSELFTVKCRINVERTTVRRVGDPQPTFSKITTGTVSISLFRHPFVYHF